MKNIKKTKKRKNSFSKKNQSDKLSLTVRIIIIVIVILWLISLIIIGGTYGRISSNILISRLSINAQSRVHVSASNSP